MDSQGALEALALQGVIIITMIQSICAAGIMAARSNQTVLGRMGQQATDVITLQISQIRKLKRNRQIQTGVVAL